MILLPVSRGWVQVAPPTGVEDLLLAETPGSGTGLALALVARLVQWVQPSGAAPAAWEALPVPDLEVLLLLIRQTVFGDQVRAETRCATPACGARVDVDFSITQYLAHHLPRRYRNVEPDDATGWYRFQGSDVRFRLPTVADQLAVASSATPAHDLARRCIDPPAVPARLRYRVERAMAALAPTLSHELAGQCPECGRQLAIYFGVQEFTLRELRDQARYVFGDIHLIARHYHWSEAAILALPRRRRMQYAERIRQELGYGSQQLPAHNN